MIRAGEYRHQIIIQRRSTEQDSAGETLNTWTQFASRRASVAWTPGSEVFAAAQRAARAPVVFEIRYLEGVTEDMRVVFGGVVHNITSVVDQGGLHEKLIISTVRTPEVVP